MTEKEDLGGTGKPARVAETIFRFENKDARVDVMFRQQTLATGHAMLKLEGTAGGGNDLANKVCDGNDFPVDWWLRNHAGPAA